MNYIEANNQLNDLLKVKDLNGYEVKLLIKKNIILLNTELTPIGDQQKETEKITAELLKERNNLYKDYSDKDKNFIEEKRAEYEEKYEALNVKYKKEIDEFNEQAKQFEEFIKKECPVKLIMIPHSKLMQYDAEISDENFEAIFKLIDETK